MSNEVTFEIATNNLGRSPASGAKIAVTMGICSKGVPNQFYSFSDPNDAKAVLGQGPLVEALADKLTYAGGPQYAMPLPPITNGAASATNTSLVTGAATVVGSVAPAQTIALKIIAGGALATMTFSYSVNGAAYSAPVSTVGSPFPYVVPGTLIKITFAAGTYVLGDVYTISTLGVVTLVGTGPSASNLTFTGSPIDAYDIRVTIALAGALGTALFTVSVDGGNSPVSEIVVPSGGKYAIPNTGVVLTFSGTFVALDVYSLTTTTAAFGTTEVSAAFVLLRAGTAKFFAVHVVGEASTAAGAASMAAVLSTQVSAAEAENRFVRAFMGCPTLEVDATIAAAFATFSDRRVGVCVGDYQHISSVVPGRRIRRNSSIAYVTRLCATPPSEHPGWVGSPKGPLKAVGSLYPNFGQTTWSPDFLDSQRFVTLKSRDELGYFVKKGNMMAPGGDDFAEVMNCRVMDVACTTTFIKEQPYLNGKLATKDDGTLQMTEADSIDANLTAAVSAEVVGKGDAVRLTVAVSRSANVLTLLRLPTKITITPFAYAEGIDNLIGFINPAIAA